MNLKEMLEMKPGERHMIPGCFHNVEVVRVPGGWLYVVSRVRAEGGAHAVFVEEPAYAMDEDGNVEEL